MSASNKGGYGGPNTAGPGGQGRDYNGNAIGSRWPGQYAVGGPAPRIGFGGPTPGGRPAPGDLYQRPQPRPIFGMPAPNPNIPRYAEREKFEDGGEMGGLSPVGGGDPYGGVAFGAQDENGIGIGGPSPQPGNRFTPRGMIPPAGGRPQPGQPTGPYTRQRAPQGDPARYGQPQPNPRDVIRGVINPIFGGIGGGKGGFPGPRAVGGPAPIQDPGFGYGVIEDNNLPGDYDSVA